MYQIILVTALLMSITGIYGQQNAGTAHLDSPNLPAKMINQTDSLDRESILFTPESASAYLIRLLDGERLWSPSGDTMRLSLARLLEHYKEPFDSVERRLNQINFDSLKLKRINLVQRDTLQLRWLNDSTAIIDTMELEKEPYIIQKTILKKALDTSNIGTQYNLPDVKELLAAKMQRHDSAAVQRDSSRNMQDTTLRKPGMLIQNNEVMTNKEEGLLKKPGIMLVEQDTIIEVLIDTLFLKSRNILLHKMTDQGFSPSLVPPNSPKTYWLLPDSSQVVVSDAESVLVPVNSAPFYILPNERMPDSLKHAVETLVTYTAQRDSILLYINDISGHKTPFWLTTGKDDLYRYWVKNYKNDSITIWMGNPSKHDLTLILEQDVNVNRLNKLKIEDFPITEVEPVRNLAKVEPLKEIPVFWDYSFSSTFALNQTFLSNWSKGGESSFSNMLDIDGTAKHTNKKDKTEWTNNFRLKYGSTITEEYGLRTNTDMFNLNSQFNKVIQEKVDFSAVFFMKNQIARGYKYPNDSVVVSKFLNPGSFTVGAGLEYKPFKKTTLNFSVLSYKNTFVLDTANIDQTRHGIDADKKLRQEMGGQLVVKNKASILDGLEMSNTLRLFTNYLNKPQNVDVDWEISMERKINWYFTVLLNLHFIYDDDIRFPVIDENGQPVLLPDGTPKKTPKLQFKEFLGITLSFKF